MKTARVAPVCKSGVTSLMTNYRTIFALPWLSKMLERIMYNRVFKYLTDQFFEKNEFTLAVFLDLSKTFVTVDHQILFKNIRILWHCWE